MSLLIAVDSYKVPGNCARPQLKASPPQPTALHSSLRPHMAHAWASLALGGVCSSRILAFNLQSTRLHPWALQPSNQLTLLQQWKPEEIIITTRITSSPSQLPDQTPSRQSNESAKMVLVLAFLWPATDQASYSRQ